jgi:hypothetical protein
MLRCMSDPADHLERAYQAAEQAVDTAQTPQQALERAGAFYRAVEDLRRRATDLRKQTTRRIWKAEELSLSWLAKQVGVSKSRAGQLVDPDEDAKAKAARAARKGK